MTTRRAKVHRDLVHCEENAKHSLRAKGLIERLIYLDRAVEAQGWYLQWKKKKQPRGTAESYMK